MYFIFIFWHILAVIGIRVRWIAPSSGASSHHLCVWKLRSSSCCSSHSLLLNTEIHVMVLIPSLLLLLAFALTSSLCALYIGLRLVIRRHRSLLMLPDGLMTRTALYSSLSTCDDILLYCTNTYNNHTRKWKYFRWFIYLQKSNEILYSMLK